MSTPTIWRQGDVLILRTDQPLPATAQPVASDAGRVILAYGEVTGHAHALSAAQAMLYAELTDPTAWLVITEETGADVVHEEHATIHLPPGIYRVQRQVEYAPESIRTVAD